MMNLLIAVMSATHFEVTEATYKSNYSELNNIILELENYIKNWVDEDKYVKFLEKDQTKLHQFEHIVFAEIGTENAKNMEEKPVQQQF